MTYTKKVLCTNSCVKANQVGANLAKMESEEKKLFRSDRESIVIFYPLTLYAFLKLGGERKQYKQTKKGKKISQQTKAHQKERIVSPRSLNTAFREVHDILSA